MGNYISINDNHKGNHVFADFTGFYGDENELGKFVFELMIRAIEKTDMKIVHRHLEILNDDTPPGFTSILLLDTSHITAHSYTGNDQGLLAFDCFTCGVTDTVKMMNYIKDELLKEYPEIKCTYLQKHKRFNF
jgi:S-adenosylmethionine decarboxylase